MPDVIPADVYLDAARRYCADTTPLDEHVTCTAEDPLFRDAIDLAFAAGRAAADTELAETNLSEAIRAYEAVRVEHDELRANIAERRAISQDRRAAVDLTRKAAIAAAAGYYNQGRNFTFVLKRFWKEAREPLLAQLAEARKELAEMSTELGKESAEVERLRILTMSDQATGDLS